MNSLTTVARNTLFALLICSPWALLSAQDEGTGLEPEIVKEVPKSTVTFAKTWDAAVEEAKLLNMPIVVHSHGFY